MIDYLWNGETYTESQIEDFFNDMLDEVYGPIDILGVPKSYSYVVKESDYIAWREALNNWIDSEGIEEL